MTFNQHHNRKAAKHKTTETTPKAAEHSHDGSPSIEQVVQRASEMPPALLRESEVIKLQGVIGNRATTQMLRPSVPSGDTADAVIQRAYQGELINYATIDSEKNNGEIATGFKLTATLTKRVAAFEKAVKGGNPASIRKALLSINQRLNKDSQKKLKKPKTLSKTAQKAAATLFFAKWKRITQEHIDHLTLNSGAAVIDFQESYGFPVTTNKGKEEDYSEDEGSSSGSLDIITTTKGTAFDFNNPAWDTANDADVKGSGKGGAVILTFPGGHKVAVKRNSPAEVLGARMARESGLPMPETRLAAGGENEAITQALTRLRAGVQFATPYTVIDYISGVSVTEALGGQKKVNKTQVNALAASMGRWFAFNILTGDNDNFTRLVMKGSSMGGVNTGNYMVGSESPDQVTAIDQTVMGSDLGNSEEAVKTIMRGDGVFAYGIANDIIGALGRPPGIDSEDLIDVILQAAKDQLRQSSQVLTRSKILELSDGLGVNNVDKVIDRVEGIAAQFG
jgi:hypothetical protein